MTKTIATADELRKFDRGTQFLRFKNRSKSDLEGLADDDDDDDALVPQRLRPGVTAVRDGGNGVSKGGDESFRLVECARTVGTAVEH